MAFAPSIDRSLHCPHRAPEDDDDTGMRADNPILVAAESVAVVSRVPLAAAAVREEAEIMPTE